VRQLFGNQVPCAEIRDWPARHRPWHERAFPWPRELERLAAARVLDVCDEPGAVPVREDASHLWVTEPRLVLEDPKAVARQRKQARR